jgi:hypothetical protein
VDALWLYLAAIFRCSGAAKEGDAITPVIEARKKFADWIVSFE